MSEAPTSLKPRLLKSTQADYVPVHWDGVNTSGLQVWGKNILLCMDSPATTTQGGVYLTDDVIERHTQAAETGCIFAMGPEAFRLFDDGTVWTGDKPQVGDRVYIERYAGILARGEDGRIYRIMDYRAVAAGLRKDEPA